MSLLPTFRDRLALKPAAGVNLDQGFPYGNCSLAAPFNEVGGTRARNWANNKRRCPVATLVGSTQWTKGKYGPSITVTGGSPVGNSVNFGNTGTGSPAGALTNFGVTMVVGARIFGSINNPSTFVGNSQTGAFGNYVQLFSSGNNMRFVYGAFNSNGTLDSAQDLTGDNIWCFSSGVGRGMEVWRNGVLTASHGATGIVPSADNYSVNFLLGGDSNQASTSTEYHFVYVWPYQLDKTAILMLFRNPWIIWLPPDGTGRETPIVSGGGGGPVAPTCSLTASTGSAQPGAPITLTWTTTNTPTTATIDQGVGAVTPATGGSIVVTLTGGATTTWVLTVSNAGGSSTCSVTVFAGTLGTGCNFVLSAVVGVPYSHTFVATSGTPPYTFSISAGNLPFGLTLTPSTGVVSGTPTQSGIFFFTVTATDSNGLAANVDCSMPVSCP